MAFTGAARNAIRVARDRELTFMAAGIAHYALASIVPLLLLALSLGSILGGEEFVENLVASLAARLPEGGETLLAEAFVGMQGQVGAGIVGLAAALWSGSKVFRGLTVAFSAVYDRRGSPSLVTQLLKAVLVLGLVVLAVAAMEATGVIVSRVPLPFANPTLVGSALLFVSLVLLLLPIYYVMSPVPVAVREVLPGTLFGAAGFIALQVGLLYYAGNAAEYRALGALGAILLFVVWLYFGGVVLLLGAVINYVNRLGVKP